MLRSVFRAYRIVLSPALHLIAGAGAGCRFEPTCGAYAEAAFRTHGPLRATQLTAGRVLRCHPFSKGGLDPVPESKPERGHGIARANIEAGT